MANEIAEERGIVNVEAMLRSLTARQFMGLVAYKRVSPFKELRADYRAAQVDKAIYDGIQRLIDALFAVNGVDKGKRPKLEKVDLAKFVLQFDPDAKRAEKPKQTWQQQLALLKILAAAYATQ